MSIEYFYYLKSISWKGKVYRRLFVYPTIKRFCKGDVLDIGCGIGLFLEYYKAGVGTDINEHCVEFCVERGIHAKIMKEDTLNFQNSTFDTLIMDNVMEHISNPAPLLMECDRVMKPDGALIILVPGLKGFSQDPDHEVFYDFDKLRTTLQISGFKVYQKHSIPFPGLSSYLSAFCFMVVAKKC